MGFNRRKLEDQRREAAEKEAANRRATDVQVLEDAERLIAAWNERQAKRMPMLFLSCSAALLKSGSRARSTNSASSCTSVIVGISRHRNVVPRASPIKLTRSAIGHEPQWNSLCRRSAISIGSITSPR